ncbi:MAG: iron-siderophore ABC transporter substrate-binding protein [Mycobacteriaceae bacterium]|nr:iron-siderophore ABC transporter substrate-binding protein [Mycobacteriaceae bacterium]
MLAAIAAAATAVSVTGCLGSAPGGAGPSPSRSVLTSTTKVAGAGVLGNERRPDDSCAPQPAAPDPGPPTRQVRHAAGESDVPADPQRIVVLSGDQLDALCALGLQSRIVAAALPDDSANQPWYLGTVVHNLPAVGTRSAPDLNAIQAARPDLILGSQALTPEAYPALAAIAPTVFTGAPGAAWEDNVRLVGAATGRAGAANGLVDEFNAAAGTAGADSDAPHFQASVVQLTENTMRLYGAANFPGSVLADFGVDRPASQRFTDKPYLEIGTSDADLAHGADLSPADGDVIYVSFSSSAAKDRAERVFDSDAWRQLSANRDNRVFVVNNEVWQTGQGIVAARAVVADLKWVNAPIN